MELLEQIKENAKKQCKTIVLPEGTEERTIQAADQIIGEGIAKIILIGNPAEIQALAQKHNLKNKNTNQQQTWPCAQQVRFHWPRP